jgi:hypothetical protein
MSDPEPLAITRSDLYELVWTTPRSRLAQQFGLSDVGLSKLCKRCDIPQPPRGYWAQLEAGKAPEREPLSEPERNPSIDIRLLTATEAARRESVRIEQLTREARAKAVGVVEVPDRLERPHGLVKATQGFFAGLPGQLKRDERRARLPGYHPREAPYSDNGRFQCLDGDAIPIKVSVAQADRALRILDTLLKRLEISGFLVDIRKPDPRGSPRDVRLRISKGNEACAIELIEGYSRTKLTDEERAELRKSDPQAYRSAQANGRLALTVTGIDFGGYKSWRDSETIPLENRLVDIVAYILELNPRQSVLREQRRRDDEARARREAQAQRQRSMADQRDAEFKAVLSEARMAHDLAALATYVERIEQAIRPANETQTAWIEMIRTLTSVVDPYDRRIHRLMELGTANLKEEQWLRQIDEGEEFQTSLIDENPLSGSSKAPGYWRQYRTVRVTAESSGTDGGLDGDSIA